MGYLFADQYSLLHFSSGVVAYFFNIHFVVWMLFHIVFELVENSEAGMNFINNHFPFWPGGKPMSDTPLNMLGDNVFAALGWIVAYILDEQGSKRGWYEKHLSKVAPK
jgi:hypothetical protein